MTEASKNVWFSQEKAGSGMEKADASTQAKMMLSQREYGL